MNTKQIIVVLAILAVAAAGIGAAYAYQAQLTSELNTAESHYLVLDTADTSLNSKFVSDTIQYDTENLDSTNAMYHPYGAAAIETGMPLKGTAINTTPFVMTIDSATMETGNWFTFYVQTATIDGLAAKDFNGSFAMGYSYTDGTYTFTGYTVLDNNPASSEPSETMTKIAMFKSNVRNNTTHSVSLTLYALDYLGNVTDSKPDYKNVQFDFFAITDANTADEITALGNDASVTVKAYAYDQTPGTGTVLAITHPLLFNDEGARMCIVEPTASDNAYTYTALPYDTYRAGAILADYAFGQGADAVVSNSSKTGASNVQEIPTALKITVRPTSVKLTSGAALTTVETTLEAGAQYDAVFHENKNVTSDAALVFDTTVLKASTDDTTITVETGWYKLPINYTFNGETVSTTIWVEVVAATP